MSEQNQNFRAGVKDWIKDNFPSTLKGQNPATAAVAADWSIGQHLYSPERVAPWVAR